jgi:hypothetical protein
MIFKRLKEVFDQLPEMQIGGKVYNPVFHFGTESDLRNRLSVTRKSGERHYPLIWLNTPVEEAGEVTLNFIIATLNRKTDMGNWDRLNYTFGDTLEPLFDNIMSALKRSRTFKFGPDQWDKNYRGEKYFNYHISPDIWDAIQFTVTLRYSRECAVKTINF